MNKTLSLIGGLLLGAGVMYAGNSYGEDLEKAKKIKVEEKTTHLFLGVGLSTNFEDNNVGSRGSLLINFPLFEKKGVTNRFEANASYNLPVDTTLNVSAAYLTDVKKEVLLSEEPSKEVSYLALGPRLDFQLQMRPGDNEINYLGQGLSISKGTFIGSKKKERSLEKYLLSFGLSFGGLSGADKSYQAGMCISLKGLTEGKITKKIGMGFLAEANAIVSLQEAGRLSGFLAMTPYIKIPTLPTDFIIGPTVRLVSFGKKTGLEALLSFGGSI
ncbi:MAG: hypothetical protein ABIB71_01610 [Candidatus Woesearchaeota archaeon]